MLPLSGWANCEAITLAGGIGDVTNFTKFVFLTNDAKRANALATGFDVRFTTSDGTTLLFYKREAWTGGGGSNVTAIFKVLVASIAQTGGALIYIHWGNAAAGDVSTTTNCWKATLAEAWPMDDLTTSSIAGDRGNNGTKKAANEPEQAAGKIGLAQSFDGADDFVDCGASFSPGAGAYTIAAWVKSGALGKLALATRTIGAQGYDFAIGVGDVAGNCQGRVMGATTATESAVRSGLADGAFHLFVLTGAAGGTDGRFYVDGSLVGSPLITVGNITAKQNLYLARRGTTYFAGLLDDVRYYSEALTAAEIEYLFGEVNEAGNRCTFGGVEYAFSPAAAFLNLKTRSAA